VAAVSPPGAGRAVLCHPRGDHPGHQGGDLPAECPRPPVGLGAPATVPASPTPRLHLPHLRNVALVGLPPSPEEPPGWQPSRFLTDRAGAQRTFARAERLGSINAAAAELGTTWPSLRKAFTRHGLGMPTSNPEVVRQRAIDAARQRSGKPQVAAVDSAFVALNRGGIPIRARSDGELAERVRRAEDYAVLGVRVVVELHTESHAAKPSTRAWAITRRADRAHRRQADRQQRADRSARTDRPHQPQERGTVADAR
jgi:hypothetical protein